MNGLIRWEPFREMATLRQAIDRLFDDSLRPTWRQEEMDVNLIPPVDMVETDKDVVIKAVVPGVADEDLTIDIAGNTLTIKGESKTEKEEKNENHLYREFRYGTFTRSLTLPAGLNTEKAEAELENGILRLTLPKAESAKPKAIKVKAKKEIKSPKEAEKKQ